MEINTITTTTYPSMDEHQEAADAESRIGLGQLPKLLWIGALLFAVNLAIGASIISIPEMSVDIYGKAMAGQVASTAKPSPFVNPEPTKRTVRSALKLQPIVETIPESEASLPSGEDAAYIGYVEGGRASQMVEREADFLRTRTREMRLIAERPLLIN